jgi:predicted MFS family arabinose efflux permease
LTLGFALMIPTLLGSLLASSPFALLSFMVFWTLGMCFTWPNLEALAADRLSAAELPKALGCYNVVWAGCSALSYFSGGAMIEILGWKSIFWLPAVLHGVQLVLAVMLQKRWQLFVDAMPAGHGDLHEQHPQGKLFLRLSWIANPFAYIAINAIIPIMPDLSARLQLSAAAAGVFCSAWFFMRMVTFIILALWPGWHYRLSYLLLCYVGMLGSFAGMLLIENFWLILLMQAVFGWCIGLIYYSSLYYSMHVGDTKGEHGGFHEAAIGAGIFGGPAIGAASLYLAPSYKSSNVFGVAIILAVGLAILFYIKRSEIRTTAMAA